MNNYFLDDFLRDVLGCTPPWTLRDLGTPWPTPAQVEGTIEALERMLLAERGEAGE